MLSTTETTICPVEPLSVIGRGAKNGPTASTVPSTAAPQKTARVLHRVAESTAPNTYLAQSAIAARRAMDRQPVTARRPTASATSTTGRAWRPTASTTLATRRRSRPTARTTDAELLIAWRAFAAILPRPRWTHPIARITDATSPAATRLGLTGKRATTTVAITPAR